MIRLINVKRRVYGRTSSGGEAKHMRRIAPLRGQRCRRVGRLLRKWIKVWEEEVMDTSTKMTVEKVNTNIKTCGGTLKEIPLERVLDPFSIG